MADGREIPTVIPAQIKKGDAVRRVKVTEPIPLPEGLEFETIEGLDA